MVEAMQWDGGNADKIVRWAQGEWKQGGIWLKQKWMGDEIPPIWSLVMPSNQYGEETEVRPDDWIVRGGGGLFVLSQDDFADRYEVAE